jgi:hypothetical protein
MDHSRLNLEELDGIKLLRKRIRSADIPSSSLDETLNLCTWNIRHWGQKRRQRFSLHCIAEIFFQFDLIAVTELRRNVSELKYVLDLLGPYWKAVFSDYTTDAGGNKERIAFVYDSRAVKFTGLAAETDGPRKKIERRGNTSQRSIGGGNRIWRRFALGTLILCCWLRIFNGARRAAAKRNLRNWRNG